MILPDYPEQYFDYSEGINITDKKINEFINEGFEYLKINPDAQFYNNGTGNTSVTIFREMYGEFSIIVAKNYQEYWVTN